MTTDTTLKPPRGACAGLSPDIFHPERGVPAADAKAICAECPVRAECLNYAMATGQRRGVWGGLSEQERRKLRRRQAVSA